MWKEDDFEEDLEHAIRKDRARGTKKSVPDSDKIKERKALREKMKELLSLVDEELFLRALIDGYGLDPDSEKLRQFRQIWQDYRRSQKKP